MVISDGNISLFPGRPIVFGEVLFDCFPDGSSALGGAPFNVAWHLQGFGLQPLFVSRIGDDVSGEQVRDIMQQWGMDISHLQRDAEHPTGQVAVTIADGQPSYAILPDQAYDFIETPVIAAADFSLVYHGSLITRSPTSRAALDQLCEYSRLPLFMDVNLRDPWWEQGAVMERVKQARWVKLNDEELDTLLRRTLARSEIQPAAEQLRAEAGLELLVVTLGADGAWILTAEGAQYGEPVRVDEIADTVGAGDAFSAVILLGLLSGWSVPLMLQRALQFAAQICRQRGATALDRSLYDEFIQRWRNE